MSMEMYVAFNGTMPTGIDLDGKLMALGFPYRLLDPPESLDGWSGYLPVSHDGRRTGAELDVFDGPEAVRDALGAAAPQSANRIATFRWAGDVDEAAFALAGAAALASIVNGIVFDPSEGSSLSVDQTVELAREAGQAT